MYLDVAAGCCTCDRNAFLVKCVFGVGLAGLAVIADIPSQLKCHPMIYDRTA